MAPKPKELVAPKPKSWFVRQKVLGAQILETEGLLERNIAISFVFKLKFPSCFRPQKTVLQPTLGFYSSLWGSKGLCIFIYVNVCKSKYIYDVRFEFEFIGF